MLEEVNYKYFSSSVRCVTLLGLIILNWNLLKQTNCGIWRIVVDDKTCVLRLVKIVYRE